MNSEHFSAPLTHALISLTTCLLLVSCDHSAHITSSHQIDIESYNLGSVGAFSEMINAGVKQLALSSPMSTKEMDAFMPEAEKVAGRHDVKVFREKDLMVTDLFPADVATGKEVLLLYQNTTLDAYNKLKSEWTALKEQENSDPALRQDLSRRFGRMLSYSPRKINSLLSQNTPFRTMDDFGIMASNLFLYYKDLEGAERFYADILGMEMVSDYEMAKIFRMAEDSYLILVDATKGMHTAEEPKTVALALLTRQLDEWYEFLKTQDIKFKYEFNPGKNPAHDGFVIEDPEGYLLEFERFHQHPENEPFIPLLNLTQDISDQDNPNRKVPTTLNFHATITWLYYKDILHMQGFMEDVLGLEIVADQGWTKIYKGSDTGFIGLVDERRGMHSFSEKKAVNVSFILEDVEGWFNYCLDHQPFNLRSKELGIGPENKYKAFVGFDPEGYYWEFDTFYPHNHNQLLLGYLED